MVKSELRSAFASPEKKAKLCKICAKYFKIVQKKYKFSSIELSNFIDSKLIKEINALIGDENKSLKDLNFTLMPQKYRTKRPMKNAR